MPVASLRLVTCFALFGSLAIAALLLPGCGGGDDDKGEGDADTGSKASSRDITGKVKKPQAYFLDVRTDTLFTADADRKPPIKKNEDDLKPTAVRVYRFTCDDCDKVSLDGGPFNAYLETYDGDRRLVREPGAERKWVDADSPEGKAVMTQFRSRCDDPSDLKECKPDPR